MMVELMYSHEEEKRSTSQAATCLKEEVNKLGSTYFLTFSTSFLCFLTHTTFYENISILNFRVGTGLKIFFRSSNKQAHKCQFLHKMLLFLIMKKFKSNAKLTSYESCGWRLFKSKSNVLTRVLQRKRI